MRAGPATHGWWGSCAPPLLVRWWWATRPAHAVRSLNEFSALALTDISCVVILGNMGARPLRAQIRFVFIRTRVVAQFDNQETSMDTTTLLLIIIIVLLVAGGGFYGRGRWY